jgi:general secretion pathway protein J
MKRVRRWADDRRERAFTLVELLIALAILAILAVLGYRGVAALTESEVRLTAEAARWRALDTFFARFESDLRTAQPRAVRIGSGTEPPWLATRDAAGNAELRISRAGTASGLDPGSAGQRIGYRFRERLIEVLYWPHLDQPSNVTPAAYALVEEIAAFRVDCLDSRGAWRDSWPIWGEPALPRAVRVGIVLGSGETIERWFALQ